MKDKKWFKEACYQYAQTTGTLVNFIERIYTQGRADQNEADVKAFVVAQHKHHGFIHPDIATDLYGAIRAAGPEEK
jgi:hypothetical protein